MRVPIPLKEVTHPEKKLGVWTCPTGNFGHHVSQAILKGENWATGMRNSRCPPRDAWLGLRHQLYRQMSYGFVALVHPPDKLEKSFQDVWYKCLPSLQVNRCIRTEWKMLPIQFQGLGLPNPNIDVLACKIQSLQRHWNTSSVTGKMLHRAYEVFQVEVGLGGNIFALSFEVFGDLASMGWFAHLWQLLDRYNVQFSFEDRLEIPMLREDDSTFMDWVYNSNLFTHQ